MSAGECLSQQAGMYEIRDSFRDWLRGRMDDLGLTPSKLAADGVASPSNARNWYIGANTPDWHSCYKLAKAIGVSKEEVRRRAGFTDPEDDPIEDATLEELLAVWPELDQADRDMHLRLARLQFGSPRRRGQA